jgi:hypothetical protein
MSKRELAKLPFKSPGKAWDLSGKRTSGSKAVEDCDCEAGTAAVHEVTAEEVASVEPEGMESEYEVQRLQNIKRNQAIMDTLGIGSALQVVNAASKPVRPSAGSISSSSSPRMATPYAPVAGPEQPTASSSSSSSSSNMATSPAPVPAPAGRAGPKRELANLAFVSPGKAWAFRPEQQKAASSSSSRFALR